MTDITVLYQFEKIQTATRQICNHFRPDGSPCTTGKVGI